MFYLRTAVASLLIAGFTAPVEAAKDEKQSAAKEPAAKEPAAKEAPKKAAPASREYVSGKEWKEPTIVNPGDATTAPSDAIVIFDGKDLAKEFTGGQGWTVKDGVATVGGGGGVTTRRSFGSCQLHIEWATPDVVKGEGQGRGNSGVYLMGIYEVQILDSYENKTYFDGQAGSIYKQRPPLVNVCRKPGEWQTYDIIFTAPKFADDGKLLEPAYMTVLQNGVLVQNHFALEGGTFYDRPPSYTKHADKLPFNLQNHGNPTRFRNIWIREL
ncbi:MAG: DUF1080 domain-containing protein [Planctomycetia bacterium]|nr:DUF1080 domain-containing protein [Planctomycetia bacterium]